MKGLWPFKETDKEIQHLQTQLNFVDGQITQSKQLIQQMQTVLKNHETNRERIQKQMDLARQRKRDGK